MHVHAYDLALLLFLLPSVSASRVRGHVHVVDIKGREEELFVPGVNILKPVGREPVRTGLAITLPGFRAFAEAPKMMAPSDPAPPVDALLKQTSGLTHRATPGRGRWSGWVGETVASLEIEDVPVRELYDGYANLTRMPEWSPMLDSVIVDSGNPSHSFWVMRVPRLLRNVASVLGYPSVLTWEADLEAPGPPSMTWTSSLDEDGNLKGLPNAGFLPSGSLSFLEVRPGVCCMSLTLRYALPEGTPAWKIALARSPLVQFVMQNRMKAGLLRFSTTMRREHSARIADGTGR